MPISQMRSGLNAGNSIFSQKPTIKVPKSKFDLSRFNALTMDIGALVPVDLIPTLPGDVFDLGCQYKIDFRTMLVPTFTAYKVRLHYYYCPNQYLWSGWESFISKGRSGKLSLTVPTLSLSSSKTCVGLTDANMTTSSGSYYPFASGSLYDYLCGNIPYDLSNDGTVENTHYLPYVDSAATLVETGYNIPSKVNALPFLMYQKIYRSNYLDPNLMSNGVVKSDVWFPDDIDSSDWRYNYSASNVYDSLYFYPQNYTSVPSSDSDVRANFVPIPSDSLSQGDNVVNLTQLRYSMYLDDMFVTALPFLQRGDSSLLDLSQGQALSSLNSFNLLSGMSSKATYNTLAVGSYKNLNNIIYYNAVYKNASADSSFDSSSSVASFQMGDTTQVGSTVYPVVSNKPNAVFSYGFSAQQLRSLIALSVWQERNALTNGSYGQFVKVHFDAYPNNEYCEPVYIGGTTSLFNVNSVIQTSSSVANSPQGTQSGIGGSSKGSSIGRFVAKDYGYIMAIMSIVPDTSYVQGQEHWQFELSPDDYYMPEYEQLSYQPIMSNQLYVDSIGDLATATLFGYSNRYVYLKSRDSVAHGRFALPSSLDAYYHSYVQSRHFSSVPSLSQQFVTAYPPNIDRSFLAYPGEPAFLVQFYSDVKAVRPMSYVTRPNTFGF